MLVTSTREFRTHQKKYLDIVDSNEQVVVQRGKDKAYIVTPVSSDDKWFTDPQFVEKLNKSIKQADSGEVTILTKERQKELLSGL